jgi:DNA-binding NarL/FixJ family response regulator
MNSTKRLLHVEDDQLWCERIAAILRSQCKVAYLGCVGSRADAITACTTHKPEVIVLDVSLSDGSGLELIQCTGEMLRKPRIILLVNRMSGAVLFQLQRPCVYSLILKEPDVELTLPRAIDAALSNRKYLPEKPAAALQGFRSDPQAFFKILSDREIRLLPLFGRGDDDREIAQVASLKPSTVKSHRHRIMAKLGLSTSRKLMAWALKNGFIDTPGS